MRIRIIEANMINPSLILHGTGGADIFYLGNLPKIIDCKGRLTKA
jgi:hypothetical protein